MTCPKCSATIRDDAGFVRCPDCNTALAHSVRPTAADTFRGVFERLVSQLIALNIDGPAFYSRCTVVKACDDYFSVRAGATLVHISYAQVLAVRECKASIQPNPGLRDAYDVVVTIQQLVVYTGAIGFGVTI